MSIESKIRDMNREILCLKTAHQLKSNMITYYGKFEYAPDDDNKTHQYEITYVAGEQPIMTMCIDSPSSYAVILGIPNGNTQIMYDMFAEHTLVPYTYFSLLSTRQIVSVRRLS